MERSRRLDSRKRIPVLPLRVIGNTPAQGAPSGLMSGPKSPCGRPQRRRLDSADETRYRAGRLGHAVAGGDRVQRTERLTAPQSAPQAPIGCLKWLYQAKSRTALGSLENR